MGLIIWKYAEYPYLCTVFFIVLDLRLTKVGVQRYSFFYAHTFGICEILNKQTLY